MITGYTTSRVSVRTFYIPANIEADTLQKGCVFDKQLGVFTVVADLPVFEPEEGEVLLKSFGVAINPVDTMLPTILKN